LEDDAKKHEKPEDGYRRESYAREDRQYLDRDERYHPGGRYVEDASYEPGKWYEVAVVHPDGDRHETDDRKEKDDRHEKDDCEHADKPRRQNKYVIYEQDDRYCDDWRCDEDDRYYSRKPRKQTHVHEFEGSVKLSEFDEDVHDHRFAGISGEAIKNKGGHVHKIWTRTDFFDHFHWIWRISEPAVYVDEEDSCGDEQPARHSDKHVHFVKGYTSVDDGHRHEFEAATLIESPLRPEPEED
jgi:hypothetical protein